MSIRSRRTIGDTDNEAATSASVSVTISQGTSSVSLIPVNANVPFGQKIALCRDGRGFSAIQPFRQRVSFSDGANSLGTIQLSGSTAQLSTSTLPSARMPPASYGGDGNYAGSTSAASSIQVTARQRRPVLS